MVVVSWPLFGKLAWTKEKIMFKVVKNGKVEGKLRTANFKQLKKQGRSLTECSQGDTSL